MFLKNRNIISKIKRSKVTDYAALTCPIISVDVASIDRRDKKNEAESYERVDKLIVTFKNSVIYKETMQAVVEDTIKSSQGNPLMRSKNGGPSLFRVMYTLLW